MSNTRLSEDASHPSPTALKACPFCGAPGVVECHRYPTVTECSVKCANPDCPVLVDTLDFNSEEAAIAAWNRRTETK